MTLHIALSRNRTASFNTKYALRLSTKLNSRPCLVEESEDFRGESNDMAKNRQGRGKNKSEYTPAYSAARTKAIRKRLSGAAILHVNIERYEDSLKGKSDRKDTRAGLARRPSVSPLKDMNVFFKDKNNYLKLLSTK